MVSSETEVGTQPEAPANAVAESPATTTGRALGTRIAGGVLVLNGVLALLGAALGVSSAGRSLASLAPYMLDMGLGAPALFGDFRYRSFIVARAWIGLFLSPLVVASQAGWVLACFDILTNAAVVALLYGEPSRRRIGLAVSAMVLASVATVVTSL